jgi:hypothetical protein
MEDWAGMGFCPAKLKPSARGPELVGCGYCWRRSFIEPIEGESGGGSGGTPGMENRAGFCPAKPKIKHVALSISRV